MKKLILPAFVALTACQLLNAQPCTPLGDETSFGANDTWIGYVYDNLNLTNYRGYVNEGTPGNPNFDQSFGGDNVLYASNGCNTQTETFSVRYKLTRIFANASYDITVGADDGYRLSLDGGATWAINNWNDQGYTTTTYTVALIGSYNMVLEYYENGGGNRLSFNMVTACVGSENPAIYGTSDVWRGYVYDGTNFNSYKGMVQQGSLGNISFDQNFGGSNTSYATSGCGVQTETFSVRYRLTKNFTSGNYTFIAGGDDGYRLSFDGGATWPIDRWFDQSYATSSFTSNLNGNYNMVLEFYENGGDNRISLAMQSNLILKIDLLSFNGHKNSNEVILDWAVSGDSDPLNFIVERSADGSNFIALQTIPGSNGIRSATKQEFLCADVNPITGNSYYRLQMTDRTGKISYSNIVVIHESSTDDAELGLYPSILTHDVLYCKSGKAIGKATLRFTDMTGRVIHQQLVGRIGKGQTIGVPLGTAGLSKGLYLVSLFDGDRLLLTEKIVK